MRSIRHWTPRYVVDRLGTLLYEKRRPDDPWLTRVANTILETCLRPSDVGLEFGSGRSTLWFATRIKHLTTVEHDQGWANIVRSKLAEKAVTNVDLRCFNVTEESQCPDGSDYVKVIDSFYDRTIDFCLIDGIMRDVCAVRVLPKMKAGSVLVVDNINWYLPSASVSPSSVAINDRPRNERWCEFRDAVASWRNIWTSSGVTDTAVYFKPCN